MARRLPALLLLLPAAGLAAPLSVVAGTSLAVEAEVGRAGLVVSGRLTDDAGRGLAGRLVRLQVRATDGRELAARAWTDAAGGFSHTLLLDSGRHRVEATFSGEAHLEASRAEGVARLAGSTEVLPAWPYLLCAALTAALLLAGWLRRHPEQVVATWRRVRTLPRPRRRAVAFARAGGTGSPASGARPALPAREAVRRAWHGVATARAGGPVWGRRTPAEVQRVHGGDEPFRQLTRVFEEAWYSSRPVAAEVVRHAEALAARASRGVA